MDTDYLDFTVLTVTVNDNYHCITLFRVTLLYILKFERVDKQWPIGKVRGS